MGNVTFRDGRSLTRRTTERVRPGRRAVARHGSSRSTLIAGSTRPARLSCTAEVEQQTTATLPDSGPPERPALGGAASQVMFVACTLGVGTANTIVGECTAVGDTTRIPRHL